MPRASWTALAIGILLLAASQSRTQTTPSHHHTRGIATDVSNADIMGAVKGTADRPVADVQLRVVPIDDDYQIGIGVVHRAKTAGRDIGGGIEHSEITEVYHVISGDATLVTGGTIENAKPMAADSQVVTVLNGPTLGGGVIRNGVSRNLGPGDVVIIPPNTPHWFTEIRSDEVVYLVVRVDSHGVLPKNYVGK